MKPLKLILSIVVTGILLFLIFHFIDVDSFVTSIKNINIKYLSISVLLMIATYFVRAKRFHLMLHTKGLLIYFSISSVHFFLNKILPAKTGELSLPILFHKYLNVSYKKGTSALLLFRFLDLFSVVLLLSISLLFVHIDKINQNVLFVIALSVILLQVLFWFRLSLILSFFENMLSKIRIKKIERFKEKLFIYFQQVKDFKVNSSSGFLIKLAFISVVNWFLTYLTFYFIMRSFGVDFSILQIIFATSLANFSMLLPVSAIGGFGTFEAGWSFGFVLLGMTLDSALPIGFFTNIFGVIVSAALATFGYFFLMFSARKKRENSSDIF